MKRIIIIVGVVGVLLMMGRPSWAQETMELRGQVLSTSDSVPVPFVNIYTEGYLKYSSTGANGYFTMTITPGDTLNFSAVGFSPRQMTLYPVAGIDQKVYISPVTYELPGLTIYGRNPMEGFFDHDRLHNPETERTFRQKFPKPSVGLAPGGAAFTGLFTALANQFNSEYQQLKKLEKIKKDEYPYFRRLELIYVRLTPEYISANTSLHRDEVEGFLDFWSPSLDFMEEASDYQLLAEVKSQERRYIKEIKANNRGKDVVSTIELRKLLDNYKGN